MRQRKSISLRVPSSADHSTSSIWLRARVTLAIEVSITCSGVMLSLTRMCSGEVAITVWTRPRCANFTASAQRSMSFGCARDRPAMTAFLERRGDSGHRLDIPFGSDGEAGLDDIDAHVVEHLGDL